MARSLPTPHRPKHHHRACRAVASAALAPLLWLVASGGADAATPVYRHAGPDGTVTFSDSPDGGETRTAYRTDFGRPTATASCRGLDATALDARGDTLATLLEASAERHGLDPLLWRALVRVESCFDPRARSRAGALGLAQLMPPTAAELGVDAPFDPTANLDGGARYFARQLARFGTVELALAAYNAGPGNVTRHGGIPPFPETRAYVQRVVTAHARYRQRAGTPTGAAPVAAAELATEP